MFRATNANRIYEASGAAIKGLTRCEAFIRDTLYELVWEPVGRATNHGSWALKVLIAVVSTAVVLAVLFQIGAFGNTMAVAPVGADDLIGRVQGRTYAHGDGFLADITVRSANKLTSLNHFLHGLVEAAD